MRDMRDMRVLEDSLVVNVRDAGTREQIRSMFDKISCFLLPHPGTDMTKVPKYLCIVC